MKKILAALLVTLSCVLFFGPLQETVAEHEHFFDVHSDQWFYSFVHQISDYGIINGYRDQQGNKTGYFGPADSLTLGQALKIVSGAVVISPIETQGSHWAHGYALGLQQAGMEVDLSAYVNRYDQPVSRLLLMEIIADVLELPDLPSPFSDTGSTKVGAVAGVHIVSGHPNGTFGPYDNLLRAEMAKIAVNIINYTDGQPDSIPETPTTPSNPPVVNKPPVACFSDRDCDDSNSFSTDLCLRPGAETSSCQNTFAADLSVVRQRNTKFGFYDYCWEYDCNAQIPYPKLIDPPITDPVLPIIGTKGSGNVRIIVVMLYSYEPLAGEPLRILQGGKDDSRSLKYVSTWFEKEAQKFGVNLSVDISFSEQQYKVPDDMIVRTSDDSVMKDFYQYALDVHPQSRNYDVVAPFYYSSEDMSFYNHVLNEQAFIVFSKRVAPNLYYPRYESTNYSETFAHELAHLFGTSDKYTCLNLDEECEFAKQHGIGCAIASDSDNSVEYDITCHRAPVRNSDGSWGFSTPELEELIITEPTAKEMGWFDFDLDGTLEVDDRCPYDDRNSC